jgi:hypothetical protein
MKSLSKRHSRLSPKLKLAGYAGIRVPIDLTAVLPCIRVACRMKMRLPAARLVAIWH